MSALATPVLIKARVKANSKLKLVTGGSINIAVQPAPDLGIMAIGESNHGRVNVALAGATPLNVVSDATFAVGRSAATPGYESKSVKMEISAYSAPGTINIAAIPAAPLALPRP